MSQSIIDIASNYLSHTNEISCNQVRSIRQCKSAISKEFVNTSDELCPVNAIQTGIRMAHPLLNS